MDIFTFIIILLAGAALLLLGFFLGATFITLYRKREVKANFENYDETCEDCVFFCTECGCMVEECRPYDYYALYEDGEPVKLEKKTKLVIDDEEIKIGGKPPKEYSN